MDTEIGCFIKPEVGHAETEVQSRVQDRAVELIRERGVSVAQAGRDLGVHENVLRKLVKEFGSDPVQAFPGDGQMKPEQLEIERLRREVTKLKAERDILKKAAAYFAKEAT
jgi:transposase